MRKDNQLTTPEIKQVLQSSDKGFKTAIIKWFNSYLQIICMKMKNISVKKWKL